MSRLLLVSAAEKISFLISLVKDDGVLINKALDTVSLGVQMWALRQKCKRAATAFHLHPNGMRRNEGGREKDRMVKGEKREEGSHPLLNWTRPRDLNAHSIRVVDTSSHKSQAFVCVCISIY